ncbi:MAG: hypothetical protein M3Z02_10440 [Actinomycetota bacterium]|nr:hypothetical protein [Actinomycetota bacterium]
MISPEDGGRPAATPAPSATPSKPRFPLPPLLRSRLTGEAVRDLHQLEEYVPAWLRPTPGENRLPLAGAILVAASLQFALPARFGLHPRWLLPTLELALFVPLTVLNPIRLTRATRAGRYLSIALVAAISVDNGLSAGLLDYDLVTGKAGDAAGPLLAAAAAIYLTNVIVFGIWYWEYDRGGPFERAKAARHYPDFLFPQMASPEVAHPNWEPNFVDYLYVSFTNATAFSPTDTMPLSRWAKVLMGLQSAVSLSTTALVIARAVNILK